MHLNSSTTETTLKFITTRARAGDIFEVAGNLNKMAVPAPQTLLRTEEEERMCRLAAAVSMVESGDVEGCRIPVRRAAEIFRVPKSTVHRHIQLNRGVVFRRRNRSKRSIATRKKSAGLYKLRIGFLVNQDRDVDSIRPTSAVKSPFNFHLHLPPLRPMLINDR